MHMIICVGWDPCWTETTQSSYPDPIYTEQQGEGSENDLCCSIRSAFTLRARLLLDIQSTKPGRTSMGEWCGIAEECECEFVGEYLQNVITFL